MTPQVRRLPLAVAAASAVLAGLAPVPAAVAEAPFALEAQVSDHAGVLGSGSAELDRRLARLRADDHVQLWVVFTGTFDGLPAQEWATRTRVLSDLGPSDALLAVSVAPGSRSYQLAYNDPDRSPAEDQRVVQDIADSRVEPRLAAGDWVGAAVGAADGIADDRRGDDGMGAEGTWWAVTGIAVVLALVAAALVWSRRHRSRRTAQEVATADAIPGDDPDRLAQLPPEVLDGRARAGLVDADQAVAASAIALDVATSEFGQARTRSFADDLDAARRAVATAHALLQRLDDQVPESPEERTRMLVEVCTAAERAESSLDRRSGEFDRLRDLLVHGPEAADRLTQRAVTLRSRIPGARSALDALAERHPPSVLVSITDNVDLAETLSATVEADADNARRALSLPVGEQGPAVDALVAGEGAAARAEALLDAVDHADSDIAAARAGIAGLLAEVDDEIATAEHTVAGTDLSPAARTALTDALAQGRAAVASARAEGETDPLGRHADLLSADRHLDESLAAAGEEAGRAERTRAARAATLERARGAVREARDFIAGRDYVIGQTARTRLSSAEQTLASAENADGPDLYPAADRAVSLAREALTTAQRDASRPAYSGRHGGGALGGVIAGALVEGMIRGAGSSFGSGSGWSGGGGHAGGHSSGFGGGSAGGRF